MESSATILRAVQNHHVRADALHDFEIVRAEQHHFAARREFLNQAAQHQARGHVEAGKRLVQQDEIGIMQQRGREQHLLAHALGVGRNGGMTRFLHCL